MLYNCYMNSQPVDISQTIVYGVAFDPKNGERLKTMDLNELYASVGRLFDLLEERKVDYVLVGDIAMLAYVEGRNTQDIDLIVSPHDLDRLPELVIEDRNQDFARAWLGDLRVDLLFAKRNLFRYVANRCTTKKTFVGREVPCSTAEGLLIMKLLALPSLYRQGRFEIVEVYERDIAVLVRYGLQDTDRHLSQLSKQMLESDYLEVTGILQEIEQRISRSSGRFEQDRLTGEQA